MPTLKPLSSALLGVTGCVAAVLLAGVLANSVRIVHAALKPAGHPMVTIGGALKLGGCDSTHRCGGGR